MASNAITVEDPDFQNTGDWIELFNDYNDAYDLTGHFLTDNLGDSIKWQFPAGTVIDANSFLLIWADGENVDLHTSFKLTREAEEIGVFAPDGALIDFYQYANQKTDISHGRMTDGSANWGYFEEPTPGASNTTTAYEGLVYYEPYFSVRGGFYETPLEVELTSLDGAIHYTLDGSLPTESSPEYLEPISIVSTTNIRARVFVPGYISGKPVTHSYFFDENFETRNLPVISIATDPEYFWDADIGLYVQDFKPEWEYPINIELFENDGSNRAAFNELGGTKVNGQNSWELPQKMLGIYFDNQYDNGSLDYPLFFDRPRTDFKNFILRAGGSDWSFTLFRDAISQNLTIENMDLDIQGYRPSIAFVNGEYMGIHNFRSRLDDEYIEQNYGLDGGTYDLIENDGVIAEGDDVAFNELFDLFDQDLTVQANYDAVTALIDVPNFTDFFMAEIWASNSSYGHNIKMWKSHAQGSKWRMMLADLDRGFSGSDNNGIDYFTTDNNPGNYNWARVPLENMLDNEAYANYFLSRFTDHLYTTFHPRRATNFIDEFRAGIENEIPFHVDRWSGTTSGYGDGIPTVQFWENEVSKLYTFANERQGFMIDDLISHFNVTEASNLALSCQPADGGDIRINEFIVPEAEWSGPYFQDLPFSLTAEPKIGYEFEGWSTGNFETLIAKESEWKYLDDGSDQGEAWRMPDFNDSNWSSGQGQLGYGDGDENTEISFGGNNNNKYITSYFRKTFFVENANDYNEQITMNLLRDDGAVVYLNGNEIVRSNMPSGDITFETEASDFVADAAEDTYNSFSLQSLLVEGENVISVEIHQSNGNSSDVSFDLELKAMKTGGGDILSTEALIDLNLSGDTILIAHFLPTGDCLLPSEITENTTLTIDCSPYLAQADVRVLPNVSLTIDPGVEIHFPENASLIVLGDLQINGTADLPVRFLPNEVAGDESWGNLTFQNTTDTSSLTYFEIIGATKGVHPIQENAAISAFQANLVLDNIHIETVFGNPIFAQYSSVQLTNSFLHSEITGDLINVKYGYGLIENCEFHGNDQIDTDAIDYDEVENGVVRNSKILNLLGFNSDGIDLGESSKNVLIENNLIHNCTDKGISVGQQSTVLIQNNSIVNTNQGVAVKDESQVEIDQTTFHNNATAIACFEKNIGSGGGYAVVTNSILSNSPIQPASADEYSSLDISYTLSDTEPVAGNDNLFANPLFNDAPRNDFQLLLDSPAGLTGIDTQGNPIDLGTKYHEHQALANVHFSAIQYNPIDNEEAEFLKIHNPSDETIDLRGYNITDGIEYIFAPFTEIAPGESILLVKDANLFADSTGQIFEWTSGKLANSGETLQLINRYGIVQDQVTYDDMAPWSELADGGGFYLRLRGHNLDNHFAESWEEVLPDGVVSTEEIPFSFAVNVSPNPASNLVQLNFEKPLSQNGLWQLYNARGQEVLSEEIAGNNSAKMVSLKGLESGLYFYKLAVGNEKSSGKLSVIR